MGSREAQESRQRRAVEFRRVQQRQDSRRRFAWIAVAVVAALAIAGGVTWAVAGSTARPSPLAAVKTYPAQSRNHTTAAVKYAQNPPVGGDHAPVWLNCGVYTAPVPAENAVHDLEHGAVWITYRPGLSRTQLDPIRKLAASQPYLTVSPYKGLPAPIVASAWGVQLRLKSASDPGLAAFVAKYAQGPQTPEPGAPCSGGVGNPTG